MSEFVPDKCIDCEWFTTVRQLTSEEAKQIHNGVFIETRSCVRGGSCEYEGRRNDG